jgi:hypothetical protein
MIKPVRSLLIALGLAASAVWSAAAELTLKPLGWELTGNTDPVLQDSVPASEAVLKFSFEVQGDTAERTLIGVWIAEDVGEAAPPNTEIIRAETTLAAEHKGVDFQISRPTNGWPLGQYRLEVWQGEKLLHTQKFQIAEGS